MAAGKVATQPVVGGELRFAGVDDHYFIAIALPLLLAASSHAADVTNLRCESLENPLGIDVTRPRLSWQMGIRGQESEDRGQRQTAYQVLVASTPELLAKDQGDLWDSGKVASDRSVAIPYGGPALEAGKTYHWGVRVWDGKGTISSWSETSRWTMGKLKPEDMITGWTVRNRPAWAAFIPRPWIS